MMLALCAPIVVASRPRAPGSFFTSTWIRATARIQVEVKNEPGALGLLATVIGQHKANIINLRLDSRDTSVHTNTIDVEVHDLHQLMRLLAALRAADVVNAAERF